MRLSIKPFHLASFLVPHSLTECGVKPLSSTTGRVFAFFSIKDMLSTNQRPSGVISQTLYTELISTNQDVRVQLFHILLRYKMQHTSCLSLARYLADLRDFRTDPTLRYKVVYGNYPEPLDLDYSPRLLSRTLILPFTSHTS